MRLDLRILLLSLTLGLAPAAVAQSITLPGQPASQPPKGEQPAGTPEAEPSVPGPAETNLITSVNIASIQAVFTQNNVPSEVKTEGNYTYVLAEIGGFPVFAVPMACDGGDANGLCYVVMLVSANWQQKIKLQNLMNFVRQPRFVTVITTDQGFPFLRFAYPVHAGVSPDYLTQSLVIFMNEMKEFAKFGENGGKFTASGQARLGDGIAERAGILSNGDMAPAEGALGP